MEDEGLDSDGDVELADSDAEGEDSDADEDLAIEMDDARAKADEMGVEHLATLERLRQNQRQDYLKVKILIIYQFGNFDYLFFLGFSIWFCSGDG